MRSPRKLLGVLLILLASCASDPKGETFEDREDVPDRVPEVTGQRIRVEWRNLNPKHGDQRLGLVNHSSPEAAMLIRKGPLNLKPVEDEVMASVLMAFEESDFYEHATPNVDADSFEMGHGHGVVALTRGEKKWALVFRPTGGVKSDVPEIYRDLKLLVMNVYNQTLSLQLTTPEDAFRQPEHKHRR
jgi:hypothetical protein